MRRWSAQAGRPPPQSYLLEDLLLVLSFNLSNIDTVSSGETEITVCFFRVKYGEDKTEALQNDISSLVSLEVDWEYEPENPLGKRAWARMANKDLFLLFSVKSIPVRVVSKNYDKSGQLLDISKV